MPSPATCASSSACVGDGESSVRWARIVAGVDGRSTLRVVDARSRGDRALAPLAPVGLPRAGTIRLRDVSAVNP